MVRDKLHPQLLGKYMRLTRMHSTRLVASYMGIKHFEMAVVSYILAPSKRLGAPTLKSFKVL